MLDHSYIVIRFLGLKFYELNRGGTIGKVFLRILRVHRLGVSDFAPWFSGRGRGEIGESLDLQGRSPRFQVGDQGQDGYGWDGAQIWIWIWI